MAKRRKKQTPEERAEIDRLREEFNPTAAYAAEQALIEQRVERSEAEAAVVASFDTATAEMDDNPPEDPVEEAAIAEVETDNAKPNSVVHPKFKTKYLQNAQALGLKGKAAKRSNWDWLSQQIASQVLTEKHKLKVPEFHTLMANNGIDATKWSNRNKGWEGRLRMTGRVALQKVVANTRQLVLLDGTVVVPPEEFVAKYRDKE